MKVLKKLLLILGMLYAGFAQAQSGRYVLVLSKGEKKMWVLDYQTLALITKIPVGEDPHEIELSTDQKTAYVSNAVIAGTGHIINVIDLQKLQTVKDIDTRPFYVPHGMAFHQDTLWFTAQSSKAVIAYDLKQDKPVQVLGTGQDFTHLIRLTPDAKTFYTTNVESGTVSIYEKRLIPPYMPPTGVLPAHAKQRLEWRQTLVDVGIGAEGFDVSADGKELWTARPDGKIVIVDLVAKKAKATIDTHVSGLHRLGITPDGKTVCIVSVKTGNLLYYNAATHQLEQKTNLGQGAGIYMDKGKNRMFVSCTPNNYVSVIDLASRKEIKRIPVGRPDGIKSTEMK
ncbi:YncE family protein [Mucilaginibacter robiniae]|uniref:YncE family protein n=1 Tax=Mucilaginibacter robiniae TaxID=2728022 RepID=A0A7L5E770_9SPHI|nr:YncE family protein [Mucilaginibacter robiniae]QJD96216.1 YncE family protein [Mucilaginibacter robiniae]